MALGKVVPMHLLFGIEYPGSIAQRADASQRMDDGRTDEFRPVRDRLDDLKELFIHLECYDLLLLH